MIVPASLMLCVEKATKALENMVNLLERFVEVIERQELGEADEEEDG